jgi:hypothetical protein
MIPLYDGKCVLRKAVHNWVKKFSQACSKAADDARPDAKWLREQSKYFLRCGFEHTGKAME